MGKINVNKNNSNKRKLDDILTEEEKVLYEKILESIERNDIFYTTSSPEEITSHLSDVCWFNRDSIYKLFKKITLINEEWGKNVSQCQ